MIDEKVVIDWIDKSIREWSDEQNDGSFDASIDIVINELLELKKIISKSTMKDMPKPIDYFNIKLKRYAIIEVK